MGTWTPSQALTDFEGAYSANSKINAVLTPNDENAAPIIAYLQSKGLPPDTIPFTGQDATPTGFQNIISGYQCGTVYKPIYEEAQAAAALALYLRAGVKPPKGLVNGTTTDSSTKIAAYEHVPSVLLTSSWVTASTIESTVIAQKFVSVSSICTSTRRRFRVSLSRRTQLTARSTASSNLGIIVASTPEASEEHSSISGGSEPRPFGGGRNTIRNSVEPARDLEVIRSRAGDSER